MAPAATERYSEERGSTMRCRFRGIFTGEEKRRIQQAVVRIEKVFGTTEHDRPTWAFIHFTASHEEGSYWGVRVGSGFMVKAKTAKGLAVAVDTAREEELRRRSQALRVVSRSVSQAIGA